MKGCIPNRPQTSSLDKSQRRFRASMTSVCPSPSRSFARTTRSFENIRERKEVTFTEFTTRNSPRLPPGSMVPERRHSNRPDNSLRNPASSPSAATDLRLEVQSRDCCAYKCCGFVSSGLDNPGRAADSQLLRSTSAGPRHARTSPASQQHQRNVRQAHLQDVAAMKLRGGNPAARFLNCFISDVHSGYRAE